MSDKSKARRAHREAQQEKQAKRVIMWIAIGLLVLAIACCAVFIAD